MPDKTNTQLGQAIGRSIARQRVRANLTQEEVAARLSIGNEAVSRIERGLVIPNVARLQQFADVFGCELAELLSESSSRPQDLSLRINSLLQPLAEADRQLIMEHVERLAERLRKA